MKSKTSIFLIVLFLTGTAFADWKLSLRNKQPGAKTGMISTIYVKGVRTRTEMKVEMDAETEAAMKQMGSMMAGMMPEMPVHISQCDLKQDVFLSEMNKQFFIDYYDWSTVPPEKLARRGNNQKVVIKGTATIDSWVVDSGKRQKMFGLDARWLKLTQTIEMSSDSCEPSPPVKMEQEGWFVTLTLDSQSCPTPQPPPAGGCRPKMIIKRAANAGMMLSGTMTMYSNGKRTGTTEIETVDLSKATLDQSLFDVPKDPWIEVESMEALRKKSNRIDTTAKTVFRDGSKSQKTIAIDFFSGKANKVDQDDLRNYVSGKISSSGMSGVLVTSSADITTGSYANVIGVEIKSIKESGAAKIGGLFGKITGSTDGAKAGTSKAEIVVTLFGKDGKTAVATMPAAAEVKGSANDAVRAAIDQVIADILAKAK
ncbi:MAG: hypothetical protein KF756_12930 [Acidobacteria bacterium]|nr:hypothetical protein [Acidobacteriota bacterium]